MSRPFAAPARRGRRRPAPRSRQSRRARAISASDSALFPAPEGPRISTPRSPITHGRGVMPALMRSARRQADDEARAGAVARAPPLRVLGRRRVRRQRPIFRPDPAEVRLHDLPRDREAEAGILSETVVGAVGVEALEDALERMGRECPGRRPRLRRSRSRSPSRRRLAAAGGSRTSPPGSENEQALSMRLVITCASRESWPSTK